MNHPRVDRCGYRISAADAALRSLLSKGQWKLLGLALPQPVRRKRTMLPMSSATDGRQATMDANEIYREDIFTDRKVGTIRRLTPVTADGSTDAARPVLFVGQAQVMTPMGALPISF